MDEEEKITFLLKDRMKYGVLTEDNELMAIISGFDLDIAFNMRRINSLADAEVCANTLADVFYQLMMEQLIAQKTNVSP